MVSGNVSGKGLLAALNIMELLITFGSFEVPNSETKLTRTLWYTLGTAHDFAREWPCNRGLPSKLPRQLALKSGLNNPRGHPPSRTRSPRWRPIDD